MKEEAKNQREKRKLPIQKISEISTRAMCVCV